MFEKPSMPLAVHVMVGVTAGILIAALVIWQFASWRMQVAAEEAVSAFKASIEHAQSQAQQQLQREAQAAKLREANRAATAAAQQRQEEDARRAKFDEQSRQEAAWAKFYSKPAKCDEAKGGAWSVECANEFIRSKRRFAELYAAGRL